MKTMKTNLSFLRFPFPVLLIALAIASCEEKQEGGDDPEVTPTLSVQPSNISATAAGGSHTLAVTCNTAWTAAVEDAAAHTWCTITSGTKGSEDGTITVRAAQNTITEERHAIITVTAGTLTKTVTVAQVGINPTLNVDAETMLVTCNAGDYAINITSNIAWTAAVSTGSTWCTVSPATGTGNGQVAVSVTLNPTIGIQRSATLTFTAGTFTQRVPITQEGADPTLLVLTETITATYNAGNYAFSVWGNATWTATMTEDSDWCSVSPATGTASTWVSVNVNVTENQTAMPRAATVTITTGMLTRQVAITQAGATIPISPSSITATYNAGDYTIAVTSNATWTATLNASAAAWCTVSPPSGTGNGQVTVSVAANPTVGVERSATLTFTLGTFTRTVPVIQEAIAPTLTVNPETVAANGSARNYTLTVTSNSTWTATVNASAAAWCTVSPATGTGNRSVTVSLAENPINGVQRGATLTFTAGTRYQTVLVTQAVMSVLNVDKTAIDATVNAASYPIGITSNVTWTATVSSSATWCTLTNANATGNGTVTVNVAENTIAATRIALVTVTSGTLTRAVSVTQAALITPPNVASTQTWVFGDQTWSDRIVAIPSNCTRTESLTTSDNPTAEFREYDNRYYYSWSCVNAAQATLCPSPWRVPSQSDFRTLVSYLGGNTQSARDAIIAAWGTGGIVNGSTIEGMSTNALYWSSEQYDTQYAWHLQCWSGNLYVSAIRKYYGLQVRCVK
jgi:uncharacterized protein (TIGR02145 family)